MTLDHPTHDAPASDGCAGSAPDWLNAGQIARVRTQFKRIAAQSRVFSEDFYRRLFEIAPPLRRLFPSDLSDQRDKLVHMLAMLVARLDQPGQLAAPLASLGARHRGYGVGPDHFAPVGAALLDTLSAHLGGDFDEASNATWGALYARVTAMMQVGLAS